LGPHVSQANFEVQKDLISALDRANFDTSKALVEKKQAFYLSLRELCRQKLDNFSVEIINKESECSYEKKDKLFSFRRAKAKTSNNITFTWL
jgi:copper oxidase (laccase) domain-containing protein